MSEALWASIQASRSAGSSERLERDANALKQHVTAKVRRAA
jgi:hypothetical protein